jgi:hypothetical protein
MRSLIACNRVGLSFMYYFVISDNSSLKEDCRTHFCNLVFFVVHGNDTVYYSGY